MSQFLIIPFLIFSIHIASAQLDTNYLKSLVTNISTEKDHIDFWKFIEHRDQDMMRSLNKELIDQENLVMVSHYLNRFGYPDKNVLGPESAIINMVWVHTTSYEVQKLTFPILLQAYVSKSITKEYLLKGFVGAQYNRLFDDNEYLTKPLGVIFREIGFHVGDKIDVPLVVKKLEEFYAFLEQEKTIIGVWKSRDVSRTFTVNGKTFENTMKGQKMTMYKLNDGRIFLMPVFTNSPVDPIELEIINADVGTFKEKSKITKRYYEITKANTLRYVLEDGKVKSEYFVTTDY